jgi:DnaK suppressor protein
MATQFGVRTKQSSETGGALNDSDEPPGLTPEQIAELRKSLEDRRASIVTAIENRQNEERDLSGSRDVGDEMDEATAEGTTSMASKLLERDVRLLSEIDRALAKMDEGMFGLCEGTEEPIGYARLRLKPWARFSIGYQEELEREERMRGGR